VIFRGVCISDVIPFYLGKLFRQTGASEDLCSKVCFAPIAVLQIYVILCPNYATGLNPASFPLAPRFICLYLHLPSYCCLSYKCGWGLAKRSWWTLHVLSKDLATLVDLVKVSDCLIFLPSLVTLLGSHGLGPSKKVLFKICLFSWKLATLFSASRINIGLNVSRKLLCCFGCWPTRYFWMWLWSKFCVIVCAFLRVLIQWFNYMKARYWRVSNAQCSLNWNRIEKCHLAKKGNTMFSMWLSGFFN